MEYVCNAFLCFSVDIFLFTGRKEEKNFSVFDIKSLGSCAPGLDFKELCDASDYLER